MASSNLLAIWPITIRIIALPPVGIRHLAHTDHALGQQQRQLINSEFQIVHIHAACVTRRLVCPHGGQMHPVGSQCDQFGSLRAVTHNLLVQALHQSADVQNLLCVNLIAVLVMHDGAQLAPAATTGGRRRCLPTCHCRWARSESRCTQLTLHVARAWTASDHAEVASGGCFRTEDRPCASSATGRKLRFRPSPARALRISLSRVRRRLRCSPQNCMILRCRSSSSSIYSSSSSSACFFDLIISFFFFLDWLLGLARHWLLGQMLRRLDVLEVVNVADYLQSKFLERVGA
ncbi:hypothetical protein DL89DRAFT_64101 [Linderina pennispora]|uniref:Uncharacterized protein n=1 Tax=Linderina pennispora TaxID=61395 RepID=A0A1Y1VZ01_9FUNG|nr:uncharacterized protein DL89DRAFT_64101 [Linderina pennispora]ORX66472.1 hypothetical protein DL89DRAFT_64101 [Linderina pennispora]